MPPAAGAGAGIAASMPTPPQRPGGQVPPGQRLGPPGSHPGPPTQPYGGGRGPGGPSGYPPQIGGDGPTGSRRNLILTIIGAVVLVAAAVGIGFWLAEPDDVVTGTPGGQISTAPGSTLPGSTPGPTYGTTSGPSAPSTSSGQSPGGSGSTAAGGGSSAAGALPVGPALGPDFVVVPMRTDADDSDERPLFLVDASGGTDPQQLDGPGGKLANPLLTKDRTSIIFLEDGALHVMGSDGNGERELIDRKPAGCDNVAGASWSQTDPAIMVISCRMGKNNYRMLVVGTDGQLIRRLDAGQKRFDDLTLSPDGQTVLYWASETSSGAGGSLYTLPLIGTGAPKQLTSTDDGLASDPSWSPDGSQIAFRRLVDGDGKNGDIYVMNTNGSGERVVADTEADDVKPVWSPDGKNLLISSNRKSAFGSAGKTWDLWLTRVSDGEVLDPLNLEAEEITTPTWSFR